MGAGSFFVRVGTEKRPAKKKRRPRGGVLLFVRTSLKADWCCTLYHHPKEGPHARPADLGAASYLRWEVGVSEAVVEQALHSFVLNFGPRELVLFRLSERVLDACACEGGGLAIGLVHVSSEVHLERVDDDLDVGVLDVRVFPMILLVVWVPGTVAQRLLELLANVLQRVDHGAEVVKALFCDVVVKVLLEVEVHLLEDVVPRDVSPRATHHGCGSVLVPNLAHIGAHHVGSCGLLDGIRGVLVLVRGAEEWKKVAP